MFIDGSKCIRVRTNPSFNEFWLNFSDVSVNRETIPPEITLISPKTGATKSFRNSGKHWSINTNIFPDKFGKNILGHVLIFDEDGISLDRLYLAMDR